ncbi:hypothetical protein [Fodinibius sp.]|uniref:hypothetical protein n=1 Tax=Fodinibius sp. TaxID=1872440 RepID=UPI002ACE4B4E|nr:hypothetical protein [Fodinibius sp.]MDZ7660731.1 hypothetical protein [Fodinibius sp.]
MRQYIPVLLLLIAFVTASADRSLAQQPDPKIAFLKSLAVPGWGHHHIDKDNWQRGQYHLAADAVLILSFAGFSIHSNNLQQNWFAYGRQHAGVPIEGRSRQFQLAVGDYNSLEAYNDFQARSRNWDQLFDDVPQNRWQWSDRAERQKYRDLRSRFERIDQQLPALLGLMVVNRVISGISAYNRAKKKQKSNVSSSLFLSPYQYADGLVANLRITF